MRKSILITVTLIMSFVFIGASEPKRNFVDQKSKCPYMQQLNENSNKAVCPYTGNKSKSEDSIKENKMNECPYSGDEKQKINHSNTSSKRLRST